MITQFLTSATAKFNPFSASAKAARIFLAQLPPNARSTMQVKTTVLPKTSTEPAALSLEFKDGKTMSFDLERQKFKEIQDEVNRHSRGLMRKEELSNG